MTKKQMRKIIKEYEFEIETLVEALKKEKNEANKNALQTYKDLLRLKSIWDKSKHNLIALYPGGFNYKISINKDITFDDFTANYVFNEKGAFTLHFDDIDKPICMKEENSPFIRISTNIEQYEKVED